MVSIPVYSYSSELPGLVTMLRTAHWAVCMLSLQKKYHFSVTGPDNHITRSVRPLFY